ncbi:hypothetical protein AB0G15_05360 [Streptosporangium sp. NPDC023825]|uniref:hypothetical protein n=1 Tax=Streptosporangium sp. NPDC023825 TaxID=3154909 RepID=UPI003431D521
MLNEDEAILRRLSGIHIPQVGLVQVRFSTPETEAAPMQWPSITITRRDISPAVDREHRGTVSIDYGPEGDELPDSDDRWGWYAECPLPFNFDYEIIVRTRFNAQQAYLIALLGSERYLPRRFGALEIPQRNVRVSMDLIGGPTTNDYRDDDDKRVFEIHYLVRVFSEMTPWDIERRNFPDHVEGTVFDRSGVKQLGYFDETTGAQ